MTTTLARLIDGIPIVTDAADRDARFPSPQVDQRVENKATGTIQRYDLTLGWVVDDAFQSRLGVFNVQDYGAVGDGVTDDTAAITAAFTACPAGGLVLFAPGKTYLFDPITVTKALTVDATGATLKANSATAELGLLTFRGSVGAVSTTLTSAVTAGDTQLPVTNGASFTPGRWVRIENTAAAAAAFEYEYARVLATDATNLYLGQSLEVPVTYPAGADGVVTELSVLSGVRVTGGTMDANGFADTNSSLLQFDYCVDSLVEGVTFQNYRNVGFENRHSKHIRVHGCGFNEAAGDLSSVLPPEAGFALHHRLAGGHLTVTGCTFRRFRIGVVAAEGAHTLDVTGNTFHGTYSSALNTHFRRQLNIVFSNNIITGDAYKSSSDLTRGDTASGIYVDTTDTRVSIIGNVLSDLRSVGIAVNGAGERSHVTISGNVLTDCMDPAGGAEGSIYVATGKNVTITGNAIKRTTDNAYPGIRVITSEHVAIANNVIDFEAAQTSTAMGIRVGDSKYVVIIGNTVRVAGASTFGVRIDSTASGDSTSVNLIGNIIEQSSGTALLLSANATAVQHIANSWNTGSTKNVLSGGLLATLGLALPINADIGNASTTLGVGTHSPIVPYLTTLTNTRSCGLSTGGAVNGDTFFIYRTAGGAFPVTIGSSLLSLWPNQWCIVRYNGSAWVLTGFGRLSMAQAWAAKTGDYTVLDLDDGLFLGGTSHTLTLQSAATRTRPLTLRSTASGTWTISRAGSDTVEGATTINLAAGEAITLMPNGTNWLIVG